MSKKNRNKRSQNKVTPPKSPVKKMVLPTIGAVAVVCLLLFLFLGNPFAGKVHQAEITVTDYGVITLELDESAAPETVKNFISLAEQGFYDGLTFHRVVEGFMIQGGDPTGTGMGGSGTNIKGEFAENGYDNPISHVGGVISMARSQDPDSASSQFFIVQEDSTFLDGQYAAFGKVVEGMDIVDQICADAANWDRNPETGVITTLSQQPVIESIRILD